MASSRFRWRVLRQKDFVPREAVKKQKQYVVLPKNFLNFDYE